MTKKRQAWVSRYISVVVLLAASVRVGLAEAPAPALVSRWTDDKIVELARSTGPATTAAQRHALDEAILNPVFPEGSRPDSFFDALSSYFDPNHDGVFTQAELDQVAARYAAQYADLLRQSLGTGPSETLAGDYRVKTWKMLQKILLLENTMREQKLAEWRYKVGTPMASDEAWTSDHTLQAADFKVRVCDASAKSPVVVKFGSTQCADCTLMEYTQGVHAAAVRGKDSFALYKLWWGPNLPADQDRLRKTEGVKSSPTFIVYRGGRRYPCGFAFLDESGDGLDSCIAASAKADATSAGNCGE